jgi:hypothetical protein
MLSHPVNLGQQFLREFSVDMNFRTKGIQLKIENSVTYLSTGNVSLSSGTIDTRIKSVLDKHKEVAKNPLCTKEDHVLDLRINALEDIDQEKDPVPGFYRARNKPILSSEDTKTRIFNWKDISIPADSSMAIETATGKPGKRRLLPVKHGPVRIIPKETNRFLNKNKLVVLPGVYKRDNENVYVLIANVGNEDIVLPKSTHLGYMCEAQREAQPSVHALDHRPPTELSESELKERKDYLISALKLDQNQILKEAGKWAYNEMISIFMDNFDAVSVNDTDFGNTTEMKYHIELVPGAQPIRAKVRPLNPIQEEDLRKQIDRWLKAEVVEPSCSAWSSALVPVKKRGTNSVRWCCDFRALNKVSQKDAYPLPSIEGNLHKLSSGRVFSCLDATNAFHSLPLTVESRDLTAFGSPHGQFRFRKLPFGLTNAPATYSRLVARCLQRLGPNFPSLAFIDDIIVFSPTLEEHMGHLREVVELHTNVGMKLNLNKSELARESVIYLGHKVSKDGIGMVPEYVEKIKSWPKPETGRELASFLGFTGYYRAFIKDYTKLTADFNGMKKDPVIVWTDKMTDDFNKLKKLFMEQPVRGYPRYDLESPFIMDTDFSAIGMACVLSQVQDGQERFLGCVAKKCNEAEALYPSHKGEMASVILGLKKFEHILRAKKFVLRTDSRCVEFMRGIKECRGIWARWNNFLSSFNFITVHRAGKKQVNADVLSRRSDLPEETAEDDPNEPFHDADDIYNVEPLPMVKGISLEELQQATRHDPVLGQVAKFVAAGRKPTKEERKGLTAVGMAYINIFECLEKSNGVLYYQGPAVNGIMPERRICIPLRYQELAFTLAHSSVTSGHCGMNETDKRMRRFAFLQIFWHKE